MKFTFSMETKNVKIADVELRPLLFHEFCKFPREVLSADILDILY